MNTGNSRRGRTCASVVSAVAALSLFAVSVVWAQVDAPTCTRCAGMSCGGSVPDCYDCACCSIPPAPRTCMCCHKPPIDDCSAPSGGYYCIETD